jgi:hypothetical protein
MANAVAEPRPKLISIPVYSMLLPVPVVCFIGVLLSDRTGALIIADDVGNAVWPVSYVGAGRG